MVPFGKTNLLTCYGLTQKMNTLKKKKLQCFAKIKTENALLCMGLIKRKKAVNQFLKDNKLITIIRGHEIYQDGFQIYNSNSEFPSLIGLFSAPNYCGIYKNKGAIMKIAQNSFNFIQFGSSTPPFILPNYLDAFHWTIPLIQKKMNEILIQIIDMWRNIDLDNLNEEDDFEDESCIDFDEELKEKKTQKKIPNKSVSESLLIRFKEKITK